MYPHGFVYHRAKTLADAEKIFGDYENPSFLSGGHTLIPAMKNRLSAPEALIDLRGIAELQGIKREGNRLNVGAASTHFTVSSSGDVKAAIPALAALAGSIADPQVRAFGTMGGSLANNDPAADYPAAVLGLGGDVITNRRTLHAGDYFQGLFSTALESGEIIVRVSFPVPDAAGYAKLRSQASRFAMTGSFVSRTGKDVRVAITGAGGDGVFRWSDAESALSANFSASALRDLKPDESEMISDLHGNAAYRAGLVTVVSSWAVEHMGGACIRG